MKAEIVLSLFLFITSCHQEIKQQGIDWEQYPVVELSHPKKIVIPERDFDAEQHFHLINDCYFFCETMFSQSGEVHLYRLDKDTLKWQGMITQKGNGALDVPQTSSKVHSTSDKSIILSNAYFTTKIFTLPEDRISDISDLSKWQEYIIPKQIGYIDRIIPINTNYFLFTTNGDVSSMFATYHKGDTTFAFVPCPYPDDGVERLSQQAGANRADMYCGQIYKQSGKERILYHSSMGRYMYIFDLKDKQMENVTYLYNEPPRYSINNRGVISDPDMDSLLGFHCYVTSQYIYVYQLEFTLADLGKEYERNGGYSLEFTNELHVFDWSGKPVKTYNLDAYISDFVVDSQDQALYAITKDVETDDVSFLKYDLE